MYRTPKNQRATYVYQSSTGAKFTLRPGEDGVTEADIAALHRADDDEANNEQNQRRNGRKLVAKIESLEKVNPDAALVRDKAPLPDEATETAEAAQELREAISSLPEKQAKAVTAVWLDGFSVSEYAEKSGTSASNVRHLLLAAFKKLKNIL